MHHNVFELTKESKRMGRKSIVIKMSEPVKNNTDFKKFTMSNDTPLHTIGHSHLRITIQVVWGEYINHETIQIISHFMMKYPAHKMPVLETVCDSTDIDSETETESFSSSFSDFSTESLTSFDEEDDDSYESSFVDDTSVCTFDSICTNEESNSSAEETFATEVRQEQEPYKFPKNIMKKILESDSVRSNKTY